MKKMTKISQSFDMITVEITITIRCWDDDDDLRITERKNT